MAAGKSPLLAKEGVRERFLSGTPEYVAILMN
jgi:hypothetical protein